MAKKNKTEDAELWLQYGIHLPTKTMRLDGEVTANLVERVIDAFVLFNLDPDYPVTILLNCPGGDEVQGMAIYDLIRASPCHVTIRVIGEACSMGTVILQAADIREALPNAIIMHHTGEGNPISGHKINVKKYVKFSEKYDDIIDNIMLGRVNEKRSKEGFESRSLAWWKKEDTWDRWLSPREAIELGLLDTVIDTCNQ